MFNLLRAQELFFPEISIHQVARQLASERLVQLLEDDPSDYDTRDIRVGMILAILSALAVDKLSPSNLKLISNQAKHLTELSGSDSIEVILQRTGLIPPASQKNRLK